MRDDPVDFSTLQYTLAEVAFLGIVPEKSVRNWISRGVIKLGKQNSSGRWYFNLFDAIKVRVLGDLCVRLPMLPENSMPLAVYVAKTVVESGVHVLDRDKNGKLVWQNDARLPNINVIAYFDENGAPCGCAVDSRNDINRKDPPRLADKPNAPFRRAHLIIPAITTYFDVLYRTEELDQFRAQQSEEIEGRVR